MISRHMKIVTGATSSRFQIVESSRIHTPAATQEMNFSGAFDKSCSSITVPPPDPPPVTTANIVPQVFDKDHYESAKPWTKYLGRCPPSSVFISADQNTPTTIYWRFEHQNLHSSESKFFGRRSSSLFWNQAADGITEFFRSCVAVIVTILSNSPANLFFIVNVFDINWVKGPNVRLSMLSGRVVAFVGRMALSMKARKQDAFRAKAAYAAILMVFLSGSFTTALETSINTGLGPASLVTSIQTTLETSTVTALSTLIETATSQSLQTTSIGSPGASQSSSTPLPAASVGDMVSGGLSQNQKIGLGVGLGVGIPAVLLTFILFLNRGKLKRKPPLVIEPIHEGLY